MNNDLEHILEHTQHESLTQSEKNQMKSVLLAYVKDHPQVLTAADLPWFMYFRSHIAMSMIIALVFLSGSSSVFAEWSLPGDLFYPLKTNVNEQVLGLLATSPAAKAEWQLSLADRRLKEVETIVLTGKATTETKNKGKP